MRSVEAVKRRVSFADLQRMPDDGNRYELYDGELHVVPAPLPRHQIVAARLYDALAQHQRKHGGLALFAPLDIVLTDFDAVQPDLVYFGAALATQVRLDEYVGFPPDLAIEVLSPSTARIDRGRKRELLARHRLREYWVVDPVIHRVEISVLTSKGSYDPPLVVDGPLLTSPTVPGLSLDLETIFEDL